MTSVKMAASEFLTLTSDLLKKCDVISKKPEKFLRVQQGLGLELKNFTKGLYDTTKEYERSKSIGNSRSVIDSEALPELIVENFDDEQIWQELELQNTAVNNGMFKLVSKVLRIGLKDQSSLSFGLISHVSDKSLEVSHEAVVETEGLEELSEVEDEGEGLDDDDARSESSIELEKVLDKQIAFELGEEGEEEDEDSNDDNEEKGEGEGEEGENENLLDRAERRSEISNVHKVDRTGPRSEVDDQFFKLSEMASFLDSEDAKEEKRIANPHSARDESDDDDGVDYFEDIESEDGYEGKISNDKDKKKSGGRVKYSDFFDPPDENEDTLMNRLKRKSLFGIDDDTNENLDEMSTFEKRQVKLKEKISRLERLNLYNKPWQMMGESSSALRPENSLLAEHLQFDHMTRQAPLITEETTVKLEDIIKQRIKDKVWDDVERKIKPTEEPFEYKKRIVLDQEKSKMSLADVYEQEYLQKQKTENPDDETEEKEPKEHEEIKKNMALLFEKLDALSNFHFIPKTPRPEIRIVNNLPAITLEEVAPVGVSDGALLAPEEIKEKEKSELIGKTERSETDRKRQRREKKQKMKTLRKHNETKQKLLGKLNPGLGNKYSKAAAMKQLEGEGNVTIIDKNENKKKKSMKSSKEFFSQLQDQVKTSINLKRGGKNSTKNKQRLSAAKFKL